MKPYLHFHTHSVQSRLIYVLVADNRFFPAVKELQMDKQDEQDLHSLDTSGSYTSRKERGENKNAEGSSGSAGECNRLWAGAWNSNMLLHNLNQHHGGKSTKALFPTFP